MSLKLSFELFLDNKKYAELERITEEDLRNELCIAVKKMTVRQVTVTVTKRNLRKCRWIQTVAGPV